MHFTFSFNMMTYNGKQFLSILQIEISFQFFQKAVFSVVNKNQSLLLKNILKYDMLSVAAS